MLQAIHDRLKGIFAMTIIGILGVVFVFWGVEFVSVGGFTATQGIDVNGEDVDGEAVRRAYLEELSRYQAVVGDAEVPEEIRKNIEKQVVDDAVRVELIRQRTDEMRYLATDADLVESLQSIPAFQVDGKFSRDAYLAALTSANIEPARFEEDQRRQLAARQLDRGLFASSFVLPAELDRRIALRGERRDLAWLVVAAADFATGIEPDDAALQAYYDQHRAQYMTEERANLDYVELSLEQVGAGVAVTEEALQTYYNDHLDRFSSVEQRRARHILIAASGDDAADEARAKAAYDRARAGEDFAALAKELSADTGSAAQGGDLGFAERSFFVAPFADAVWSMQPGELRGPVRTEFGWHVIRLDEVRPGAVKPIEEVRPELEVDYRREQSERLFSDLQEQLDTQAFEAAGDLKRVADALALPVRSRAGFTRAGGGDLGSAPALVKAVFEPAVLRGEQLATVELAPGRVAAIKVVAHEAPRERPLDEVRDQVHAAVVLTEARERAKARAAELAAQLSAGTAWDTVAGGAAGGPAGSALREVGRSDPAVPPEVATAAFRAPANASLPAYGSVELPSGDAAVWVVGRVRPGTEFVTDPGLRASASREAREFASFQDATVYVNALRENAKVKVNPQLFQ
jgi:peptidyl-prolyl cis-trans isomerase D